MLSGEAVCIDLCFGEGAVCKRNSVERSIVYSLKSRFENCFGSSESSSILSKRQIGLCPVRKTTKTEIFPVINATYNILQKLFLKTCIIFLPRRIHSLLQNKNTR